MSKSIITYSNKSFFTIFMVVMVFLVIDSQISVVADIVVDFIKGSFGLALFVAILGSSLGAQYLFLDSLKSKMSRNEDPKSHIETIRKAVTVVQYALIAIAIGVLFEIFASSAYHTDTLTIVTTISYGTSIAMMSMLSWRLFSWTRRNRSLVVISYALAAIAIIVNAIASILLFDMVLFTKDSLTTPESKVIFDTGYEPGTLKEAIVQLQGYSFPAYVLLVWAGTIMLLRHNINRVGKARFGALVAFPVVYLMAYYIFLYPTIYPDSPVTQAISDNFMTSLLLYNGATIASGILFGIGFFSVARFVQPGNEVRDYMNIAGIGFVIFITAAATTVLQAAYPPYGLANVSFVGLSSFLIFAGLRQSAVSVAHDSKLRYLLRSSILKESKLLDSIGSAQLAQEVESKVIDLTKANAQLMESESGTTSTLTENEMRDYLNHILSQFKEKKV